MKATIDGIKVEGTPQEIYELLKLTGNEVTVTIDDGDYTLIPKPPRQHVDPTPTIKKS